MKHLIIIALVALFLPLSVRAEIVGTWQCGDNCTATLDDQGNFLVSGSGNMYDYTRAERDTILPWRNYKNQIKSIEIQGISHIGEDSLSQTNATKIKIDDTVTSIGRAALEFNKFRSIELPESLNGLDYSALAWNSALREIIVSDSINYVSNLSLGSWPENLNIICKGSDCDKVKNLIKDYKYLANSNSTNLSHFDLSDKVTLAGENQCNSANYYWTGDFCNNRPTDGRDVECAEGYYTNYGYLCERIKLRYTMPEADAATSDDNENMIEWIFE